MEWKDGSERYKEFLGINNDGVQDLMNHVKVILNDRYGRYGSLPFVTARSVTIERKPLYTDTDYGKHIETRVEIDMDLNELTWNTKCPFRYYNIKKVIYHDPATIILWRDGSKTVVKCAKGEKYDPEKGLAMALLKGIMGNEIYRTVFKMNKKEGE